MPDPSLTLGLVPFLAGLLLDLVESGLEVLLSGQARPKGGLETIPQAITVDAAAATELTVHVQPWVDMAARGWYSGDTHTHRTLDELPNVMLAEDLNVAFPLVDWVREAFVPPIERREASFRILFEANPLPMWVFDVETFGFLAVNDAAIARYGYSREQFAAIAEKLREVPPEVLVG